MPHGEPVKPERIITWSRRTSRQADRAQEPFKPVLPSSGTTAPNARVPFCGSGGLAIQAGDWRAAMTGSVWGWRSATTFPTKESPNTDMPRQTETPRPRQPQPRLVYRPGVPNTKNGLRGEEKIPSTPLAS